MELTAKTAPVPCDLLIDGGLVVTLDAGDRVIADGAVAIASDRIIAVESAITARARFAPRRRIDARNRIVMPGLVNTHNHTPLVITRGMVEDLGFAPMYTPRVPQGYRLSAEEAYLLSRLGAWELLRFGSTTACDNYRHPDACARAMSETGLRAFVGGRIHDADPAALARGEWRYDRAIGEATLRENLDLIARWDGHDGGRIRCFLAPHAPDTCSRELLGEVAMLSGTTGPPPHIHFAQSPDEVAQVKQRDGRRPSELLDEVGLLHSRLVAGHCIYLEPDEIARVGAAGVRVAHVPVGNASSGMMAPIKALEDAGALITLATDTKSHDLFQSMRMAIAIARIRGAGYEINARTALRWAVTNGAAALGLGGDVGALATGMKADVLLLDALAPSLRPIVDGFGIIVHSAVGANVQTAVIDGRVALEDGQPARFDAGEVITAAQDVANRLWRESGWTPALAAPDA
jgi:5-methylthioadenosine/S-adenosylhomocysteine deaminase